MEIPRQDWVPVVEDERAAERFVVREGTDEAELTYHRHGDRLALLHTGVPPAMEGKGVGSALVRAAAERAAGEGLVVVPYCPFASRWLKSHPEVAASVAIESP